MKRKEKLQKLIATANKTTNVAKWAKLVGQIDELEKESKTMKFFNSVKDAEKADIDPDSVRGFTCTSEDGTDQYVVSGIHEDTTMVEISAAFDDFLNPGEDSGYVVVEFWKTDHIFVGYCEGYRGVWSILTVLPKGE